MRSFWIGLYGIVTAAGLGIGGAYGTTQIFKAQTLQVAEAGPTAQGVQPQQGWGLRRGMQQTPLQPGQRNPQGQQPYGRGFGGGGMMNPQGQQPYGRGFGGGGMMNPQGQQPYGRGFGGGGMMNSQPQTQPTGERITLDQALAAAQDAIKGENEYLRKRDHGI